MTTWLINNKIPESLEQRAGAPNVSEVGRALTRCLPCKERSPSQQTLHYSSLRLVILARRYCSRLLTSSDRRGIIGL
jgi:hypothetical protein